MPVSDTDLRAIIAAAEQATPGPWCAQPGDDWVYSSGVEGDDESVKFAGHYHGELIGESMRRCNRQYLVAAQPNTVAALARELLERRGSPI